MHGRGLTWNYAIIWSMSCTLALTKPTIPWCVFEIILFQICTSSAGRSPLVNLLVLQGIRLRLLGLSSFWKKCRIDFQCIQYCAQNMFFFKTILKKKVSFGSCSGVNCWTASTTSSRHAEGSTGEVASKTRKETKTKGSTRGKRCQRQRQRQRWCWHSIKGQGREKT